MFDRGILGAMEQLQFSEQFQQNGGACSSSISSFAESKSTGSGGEEIIELTANSRGIGKYYSLHRSIQAKKLGAAEGMGLFATEKIAAHTVLWEELPWATQEDKLWLDVSRAEADKEGNEQLRQLMFNYYELNSINSSTGEFIFRGPNNSSFAERDCANHWNHSCAPNSIFVADEKIVAQREIQCGEEISYDYCTAKPLIRREFRCNCGAPHCRGVIREEDWRKEELQKKFGENFVSCKLNWIAQQREEREMDREQQERT
jgi:hypothetical protein